MLGPARLDARLEMLSGEIDQWVRSFFERHRPASTEFSGLLSYPLGWVDLDLRLLDPPAAAGKRLRAALCLLVCEAVGPDHRAALPGAAAVELIHNFSLVHDDIQDESPLRRGRPTVWERWGSAQAINVGDTLFALGQLALLDAPGQPAELLLDAARRLNQACIRLVEGQFLDLELQDGRAATREGYEAMVGGKTAALLECAGWLGARFGGAGESTAERFGAFGRLLGIAFQRQDDVLGIWGDPALTGKSAETDLRTRKLALPAVLALDRDGLLAERFRAIFLADGQMSARQARQARSLLDEMQVRDQADRLVTEGYDQALEALDGALGKCDSGSLRGLIDRFRTRVS